MVVVKIELWPLGFEEKKKELGKLFIANDCSGTATQGNYVFKLFGKKNKLLSKGRVEKFPRKRLLGWDLALRVLQSCRG